MSQMAVFAPYISLDELALSKIQPGCACLALDGQEAGLSRQIDQVEKLRRAKVSQISP
jgi:hypothetical protein